MPRRRQSQRDWSQPATWLAWGKDEYGDTDAAPIAHGARSAASAATL